MDRAKTSTLIKEKLSQLLVSKGVPQDAVEVRVRDILSVIGEDQVLQAYSSFDPWIVLKTLAGQKIRLVTPDELKQRKKHARHVSRSSDDGPDPWEFEDPWSQAKRSHDKPAPTNSGSLDIQLVPEHFSKENGDSADILSTIQRDACGICLLSSDELLMFSAMPAHISPYECAAVVIGDELEHAGRFPCSQVTFVAQHATAGKVLLKGSLINFGAKVIVARKAPREFALSTQNLKVITFEVRSSHCPSWQNIKHNPIRHMWRSLSKVQSKVLTTWARRYFNGKKQVAPADATSFHCFARVLAEDMRMILAQSGVEGIFITPKEEQGLAAGSYRVVWLEFDALDKALALAQTQPNVLGVVKGRGNLGLRVDVDSYISVRQSLDPTWSNDKKLRYSVRVIKKYIMAPVPAATDKGWLQGVLDEFCWSALPLRQMGGQSWLIGAEDAPPHDTITISGAVALITEYQPNKSQKMQNSAVLAAPPSIRKALDKQIQSGSYSCAVPETEPRPVVAPLPPPVQDEQLQDLRQEFQAKLQAMATQMDNTTVRLQAQISQATASASEAQKVVQANISQHAELQHNRIQALETKLEDVSKNLCTKPWLAKLVNSVN